MVEFQVLISQWRETWRVGNHDWYFSDHTKVEPPCHFVCHSYNTWNILLFITSWDYLQKEPIF